MIASPRVNRGLNLGLIGSSVSRSLSPAIHRAFFACTGIAGSYSLFDVSESELAQRLESMRVGPESMDGINVTIPHKVAVFNFLASSSAQARAAGAVNTVVFKEQRLEGHNTDILGLKASLNQSLASGQGNSISHVLIVGTGGAARAAVIALAEIGASNFQILGRTLDRAQGFIDSLEQSIAMSQIVLPQLTFRALGLSNKLESTELQQCQIFINATSIGHLDNDVPPWLMPLIEGLPKACFVQDLVYAKSSEPTICCRLAQEFQLENDDGKAMLVHQARFAFELFAGQLPPYEVGSQALLEASAKA